MKFDAETAAFVSSGVFALSSLIFGIPRFEAFIVASALFIGACGLLVSAVVVTLREYLD